MTDNKFEKKPSQRQQYARLVQKMTQQPTQTQLQKWEDEGGVTPEAEINPAYLATMSFKKRIKYYMKAFWFAVTHTGLQSKKNELKVD